METKKDQAIKNNSRQRKLLKNTNVYFVFCTSAAVRYDMNQFKEHYLTLQCKPDDLCIERKCFKCLQAQNKLFKCAQ